MRIVSLLPSATEIVARLRLADSLVGRSNERTEQPEVRHLPVGTAARIGVRQLGHLLHPDAVEDPGLPQSEPALSTLVG